MDHGLRTRPEICYRRKTECRGFTAVHVEITNADSKGGRRKSDEALLKPVRRRRHGRAASARRRISEAAEVWHPWDGGEEEERRCAETDRSTAKPGEVLRGTPAGKTAGVYENRDGNARDKRTRPAVTH